MSLAEAEGLLESSRRARPPAFIQHRPDDDLAALSKLADWCQRFSPVVGIEGSDSLMLDLTGCTHLFGGERRFARRFCRAIEHLGLSVRTAVANTIGTAWGVANFGNETMVVTASGQQDAVLAALPIAALRLPETVVQTLQELDVRRIEQLRTLPRASLPSRIGPDVARRLDQALGNTPELTAPVRLPQPAEASWEGEHPASDRRELEAVLQRLVEQVVDELAAGRDGVQRLEIRLSSTNKRDVELTVGLLHASRSIPHLMSLVRAKLERLTLDGEIARVQLIVAATAPMASHQARLFACANDSADLRELERLIDLLNNRLGPQRVVRPRLCPDPQPEFAVEWTPLLETDSGQQAAEFDLPALPRPLRLLDPPRPIQVTSIVPDGPPIRLFRNTETLPITRCWGPERIETGWWRGGAVRRDYYSVETECGCRLWLYRRIEQGDWFLHGEFE
jgi:protein ImuB